MISFFGILSKGGIIDAQDNQLKKILKVKAQKNYFYKI